MMTENPWPQLPYDGWRDTADTLHRWMQMVGKVRLAHEPWLNHSWHVPLYVTAAGIGTSLIHAVGKAFEIEFDFIGHRLVARATDQADSSFRLEPMSVAEFHRRLVATLDRIGVDPRFDGAPNEIADSIPFAVDEVHASYDPDAAYRWWQVLLSVDRVFKRFRTGFVGKTSPVHLFWGSFDMAVTRFSGRAAPLHPGGVPHLPDRVAQEAYDHEVSSAGFWPGDANHPQAAFYSYAYPVPAGFCDAQVQPDATVFDEALGEWLLPYEAVRTASDPDSVLTSFLQTTFDAAARLGNWDRSLECATGTPRRVRAIRESQGFVQE